MRAPAAADRQRVNTEEELSMSRSDVLVDADWVEAHRDDPGVVLVEVDEDTSAYDKGPRTRGREDRLEARRRSTARWSAFRSSWEMSRTTDDYLLAQPGQLACARRRPGNIGGMPRRDHGTAGLLHRRRP